MNEDELREKVNGKIITWTFEGYWRKLRLKAICIIPDNGKDISIKPYDTPREVLMAFNKIRTDHGWLLEDLSKTTFCLSLHECNYRALSKLANLSEDDLYDFADVEGEESGLGSSPQCPYGE